MTTLDPERQKQAKQYARISRRLSLASTLLSGIYAAAWLMFGWSASLERWLLASWPPFASPWLLVPAFVVVFVGILLVLELPLSYYGGFVLPHQFGQSTQALKDWIIDQGKELLVGTPVSLVLLELLYLALRVTGTLWWLWAAGGMLVFSVLLSNLAPVLIMPIFNKYSPLGAEHQDLVDRLLRLAEGAHTKVRGVYKFDMSRRTKAANAALTGMGNTRRIILGDTLIEEFTPDEIETVLAHELGHHVHGDILLFIAFGTLSTLLGLYLASLALNEAVRALGAASISDIAAFPALGLILGVYALLTSPLDNAISRWREGLADKYALDVTGKTEAFASAFTRLANQNLGEVHPERWVVWMFYSHPPIGERIAMARAWRV